MLSTEPGENRKERIQRTRQLQIIALSMIVGVCIFTGYVLWTGVLNKPPRGQIISLIGVGFAVIVVILHLVAVGMFERKALWNLPDHADESSFMTVYFTSQILAMGLLEGAAFFNAVALLQEHHRWTLAVLATLIFVMLTRIPTLTRVEHWLESRKLDQDLTSSPVDAPRHR